MKDGRYPAGSIQTGRPPPMAGTPTTATQPVSADLGNAMQMIRTAKHEPNADTRAQLLDSAEDLLRRAVEKLKGAA